MKYAFIDRYRRQFPIRQLCSVLNVSRSGFYAWRHRPVSKRAQTDHHLLRNIRRIHEQSREHYGIVKCWKQLLREGIICGRDRIARLRRDNAIYSKRRRRFVITTRSKHRHWIAPNRLNREFTITMPNRVWVGDVTFISTRGGWLYLSIMLDLFSRKVVGWSMGDRNNGQLTNDCLDMAIKQRRPKSGLIHHTDRGATYAMQSYRDKLKQLGIVSSMSRKQDCWDNAVAESFFSNLKNELVHETTFKNREQARIAIFDYIELFYNRQRLHQTLNYSSPSEFENQNAVA